MKAVALALLLALPARADPSSCSDLDGGVRTVLELKGGLVEPVDGGAVSVLGGAYLDPDTNLAVGKELVCLRAQNAELKAAPPATPSTVVVGVVAGIVVGLAGGVVVTLKLSK